MLERRQMLAFAVVVVLVGSVGVLALSQFGTLESPFYWGLEVGDEFLYSINVSLSMSGYPYGYNYSDYLSIDEEQLILRIDELPNVTEIVTRPTLLSQVIELNKISCYFLNGTLLPQEFISNIERPLFQSILPLGDWQLIDNFFLDTFPAPDYGNVDESTQYASNKLNESLYFGSRNQLSIFPNIATDRWEGWTDLDTGVPLQATYYMAYPSCTYQIYLNVTMTYIGTF